MRTSYSVILIVLLLFVVHNLNNVVDCDASVKVNVHVYNHHNHNHNHIKKEEQDHDKQESNYSLDAATTSEEATSTQVSTGKPYLPSVEEDPQFNLAKLTRRMKRFRKRNGRDLKRQKEEFVLDVATATTSTTEDFISINDATISAQLASLISTGRGISSIVYTTHVKRIIAQFNNFAKTLEIPNAVQVLAYMLATGEHESMKFTRFSEIGGSSARYAPYYGRGYVQLTWDYNYRKYTTNLRSAGLITSSESIYTTPSILSALNTKAYNCNSYVIVHGMLEGTFTGVGILRYITATSVNYRDARRVINGLDRADDIAAYARSWENILKQVANDDDDDDDNPTDPNPRCTALKGTCQSTTCVNGAFQSGLCTGSSSIRCCVPTTPVDPNPRCTAIRGTCTTTCTGGSFHTGLCRGGATVRCCVKG